MKDNCSCEPFQICKKCAVIEKTETQIENEILHYLNSLPGCLATKTGTKGRKRGNIRIKAKKFEGVGKGDIIACIRKYYVEIEVKRPRRPRRKEQIDREVIVNNSCGFYWLCESVDDVKSNLKKWGVL